jgi:hypothetical protein
MRVSIKKILYDKPDQVSALLYIDYKVAEYTSWSDGRHWLNYIDTTTYGKHADYNNFNIPNTYIGLDKNNPAKSIDTFYKILMLQ